MTALVRLAALRMEERLLLATKCAKCVHPLSSHALAARACRGVLLEDSCDCREFVDPETQLDLA